MKFDSLYQAVFLTEKEEELALPPEPSEEPIDATGEVQAGTSEVPEPNNYEVEPAPVVAAPGGDASALKSQIAKLEEFSDSLNGMDTESLLKIVNDLDRPDSLFAGIAQDTATEITRIAEITSGLVEILKGYIISSAKKQRDLAATGQ